MSTRGLAIGVDIGGTFTDVVMRVAGGPARIGHSLGMPHVEITRK